MRHWALSCLLAGVVVSFTGCGWQGYFSSASSSSTSASNGGVAVVDLDRVATASGVKTRLDEMVKFRQVTLDNEFGKFSKDQSEKLKTLVEEAKSQFGEEIPQEEAKKLQAQQFVANNNVQKARTSAQMNLNKFTEELKSQFREVVRPIAHEVAAKKGFSIVIPKNDGLLLSVEPGCDITDDVILALQANGNKTPALKPAGDDAEKLEKVKPTQKKTAAAPKERPAAKEIEDK